MIQFWQPATSRYLNFKSNGLLFHFVLLIALAVSSCNNNDTEIGLNLRPDKGELYSAETDTFTVNAYTIREDSLKTDSLSTNILGAMNDPFFGISTAAVATELTITQADISFGPAPKVDSAILYIRWDKEFQYGNLNSIQFLNLYYLNEKIEDSKKYYSDYKALLGAEIGIWNGKFNLTDSVLIRENNKLVKKAPGLVIKLYKRIGEDLANASPGTYASTDAFKSFLKGIVLLPQKGGINSGEGAISAIDFFTGNSQLIVHYNDTLDHQFSINNNCENFNVYDRKYTNNELISQLSKPGKHYNTTYVQTMAGCKTKIEIPHLLNIVKGLTNERIIINEAALVLTPLNGSVNSYYPLPSRLYLFQPGATTKQNSAIIDFLDFLDPNSSSLSIYGGVYNSLTGNYTIRFTRHLQSVLDTYLNTQENINRGFYVTIPSDKPITPSRLVLDNTRLPSHKALKFRITYSKIKT